MSDTCYLYLLVNANRQSFKIGISVDPRRRILQIPASINLHESLGYAFDKIANAKKAERLLHHLFRADLFHNPYEFPSDSPSLGDGHTEWFAIQALEEVRDFLSTYALRLGIVRTDSLHAVFEAQQANPTLYAPTKRTLSGDERRSLKTDRIQTLVAEANSKNREMYAVVSRTLAMLLDANAINGVFHDNGAYYLHVPSRYLEATRELASQHFLIQTHQNDHGVFGLFPFVITSPDWVQLTINPRLFESDERRPRDAYIPYLCDIKEMLAFLIIDQDTSAYLREQEICRQMQAEADSLFERIISAPADSFPHA